jgi:UDP-glucose 4-epimerase
MSTILVTGASGFIASALIASLASRHTVIGLSRKRLAKNTAGTAIVGDFTQFEDLRKLDAYPIDAVIHLGAVTGGCSERDGILVNGEGSHVLMRYLIDRGCKKFVMASSIAAVGMQGVAFRPLSLPIPDEHPCLDRDGYGFSKFLMEEITKYYARQNDAIDVINLRLASIFPDEKRPPLREPCPLRPWALGWITQMSLSDAVRAFTLAVESPFVPGVRIMNAVGPKAWVKDSTAAVLKNWYGNDFDVSAFEREGHERDSVYACERIKREIGFTARDLSH